MKCFIVTSAVFVLSLTFAAAETAGPGFVAEGKGFRFDTGALRGGLHAEGKSKGLFPLTEVASGTAIAHANGYGVFSHYRLLDATNRYGTAGWDWASEARACPDGSVEVSWLADAVHPFDMKAVYRWTTTNTLDLVTSVTPRKDLKKLEVFLASYFAGFPESRVYANCAGEKKFVAAVKSGGDWQAFPRDDEAAGIIQDGRWTRPPHPVTWTMMPTLAAPLGMRRDPRSGLCGVIMALPQDCFGVLTPFGEDGHRSLYLSLFGRDVKAGETASARTRLVLGHDISDEQAVALYKDFSRVR